MGKRQSDWARRARAVLIELLGGECWACGAKRLLEIDHPGGRTYKPSKLSYTHRICRYRKEYKQGKIRLLCEDCNRSHKYEGIKLQHPNLPF